MAYDITVEAVASQPAAVIQASLRREEIPSFLGGAFTEIFGLLQQQSVEIAGPPFARYAVTAEVFDVTAGFPVTTTVQPAGRVEADQLPGGDLATTIHTGSYEGLPAAFHAVMAWIETNGREIAADPWESYLDGPEVPEPRTKVCFPLVAG